MTRDEILQVLERDRARLMSALEGLDENAMTIRPVTAQWTIKDLLGHMALWHQVAVQFIADYRKTGMPKSLGLSDDAAVDAYNARHAAERHDWPLVRVRSEFDVTYRDLTAAIAGLTDQQLNTPLPAPWSNTTTLERLIAINSYEHDPEHLEQILQWRRGRPEPGA